MWSQPTSVHHNRKYLTEAEWLAAKKASTANSRDRRRAADPEGFARRAREATARWRANHPGAASNATLRWRSKPQNRDEWNKSRRELRAKNVIRFLVYGAKRRAKERGIEFNITPSDVPPMGETCPLLGHRFSSDSRSPFAPSLDRMDPTKGYVKGNIWIVGYRANLIKNDGTAEEHEMIARAMRDRVVK